MDSNATETLNKCFLNPPLEEHATRRTRMGFNTIGGEILQVPGGGLVVRSTARKDRHSKVYTAKGLRDRRVRLSAHTAIQFYDVQDRLGYDRPSKAVDWLIKKAKSAIDKLSDLPLVIQMLVPLFLHKQSQLELMLLQTDVSLLRITISCFKANLVRI